MSSRSPVDVIRGSADPEGAVTANLGTLYCRENTGTTATLYQKTSQAVAGTPDNTGWEVISPGASVNYWQDTGIFAPPDTPDPDDDEFDSTVLNAAWSAGAGVWTAGSIDPYGAYAAGDVRYMLHTDYRRSWISIQCPADGANKQLRKSFTTSANFLLYASGGFLTRRTGAATANDGTIGLIISSDPWDANNSVSIYINEQDAGTVQAEFSENDGGVTTVTNNTADSENLITIIDGVGIQKIGTTYHGWVFSRNGGALYLGSNSQATTMGMVAISVNNASVAAPGASVVGLGFIRFIRSATMLPG